MFYIVLYPYGLEGEVTKKDYEEILMLARVHGWIPNPNFNYMPQTPEVELVFDEHDVRQINDALFEALLVAHCVKLLKMDMPYKGENFEDVLKNGLTAYRRVAFKKYMYLKINDKTPGAVNIIAGRFQEGFFSIKCQEVRVKSGGGCILERWRLNREEDDIIYGDSVNSTAKK